MTNETSTIPIFIRLFERQGTPTDTLVTKVKQLAADSGVPDDITLEQVRPRDNNPSQNLLIYAVHTKPTRQRHSAAVHAFLEQIFSQLFDNHPSFVEPLAPHVQATPEKVVS